VDEALEEGVAVLVRDEAAMSDSALGLSADRLDDATVEAFDHTVGLRSVGSGEAVVDFVGGTEAIKGVLAGRLVAWLVLHVDSKAVGELTAIVGQDGMNAMGEVSQETPEEIGGCLAVAVGMDLQVDVAGGAIDRDESVAFALLQSGQVLEIDMDEANRGLLEDTHCRLGRLGPLAQPVALQTTVGGAAGDFAINAAPHHLNDIVEWQLQAGSQFADQCLFQRRQFGRQLLRRVRAVNDRSAATPPADRRLADAELSGQLGDRPLAALNEGPDLRRGGGVGVQAQLHDARRSLRYEMPLSTPIPFNQSSGTKHLRGDDSPQ
jgi:hypothetical protein